MSKHPTVLFTEPNEFVAEIVRDQQRGLVERGLVRVTKVGRPVMNGTITRVTVEAAAIVDSRCVRLRHPCGDLWGRTLTSRCSGAPASSSASWRVTCSTAGLRSAPASTRRTEPRWPIRPSPRAGPAC